MSAPEKSKPDVLPDPPDGCRWGRIVPANHPLHMRPLLCDGRFVCLPDGRRLEVLPGDGTPAPREWVAARCSECARERAVARGSAPWNWMSVDIPSGASFLACSELCAEKGIVRALGGGLDLNDHPSCCTRAKGGRVYLLADAWNPRIYWAWGYDDSAHTERVWFCPYCGTRLPEVTEAKP